MTRATFALLVACALVEACTGGAATGTEASSSSTGAGGMGGGCPNDLPASCPASAPHYHDVIGPLIAERCATCHSPGGQEPSKPLVTYADVASRKSSVLTQVYSCRMPKPGAPQLTLTEREELLAWLVCGAKND